MSTMQRLSLLVGCLAAVLAPATDRTELGQIRTVYLLPMSGGLEQYLAQQLTAQNVLQVVADPQKADAIMTERLGLAFEQKLAELYPPPPPPEVKKDEQSEEGEAAAGETADIATDRPPVRAFSGGAGRGNVFLVGRESRRVIWSIYQPPKSIAPKDLNNAAEKAVAALRQTLGGK